MKRKKLLTRFCLSLYFVFFFFGIVACHMLASSAENDLRTATESPEDDLSESRELHSQVIDQIVSDEPPETHRDEADVNAAYARQSKLSVHFIDVGQGNAVLVESGGQYMLIDAGEEEKSNIVADYLEERNIEDLDYVIGTHPHSDHIGGLPMIFKKFSVKQIFIPPVQNTTIAFEDLLISIQQEGIGITTPIVGKTYILGDAEFTIAAPLKDYDEHINNSSIALRIDFHNTSFFLAGDAEYTAELDMINGDISLDSSILLINHHGSNTSSCEEFLHAVSPEFAVISVGADNSYGHPASEVIERLEMLNITFFRTDQNGTIIAESDGDEIQWLFETDRSIASDSSLEDKTESNSTKEYDSLILDQNDETIVFITKSGKKYHLENCSYLQESKISISLSEAELSNYTPCTVCHPAA